MVRRPRGQGRKPPLGWSRGNPGGTDRSWCQGGDRVTGRKCPRQRGENGPQFPALLQAPHMPLLATQGLGDGPGLRTRCREQTRAGKGRERPRAGRPTTGTSLEPRMLQPADQAQLQSGDTGLSGRRDGHRSDKGGEGCPLGSRGSPSRSQQQQKPQSGTGRNAPGCKGQGSGPEGGKSQVGPEPLALPAHIILPTPGFRLQERWAGTVLFRPPAAGGAHGPSAVPLDPSRHCSQEPCHPCCFRPVSEQGRGTDAGGSRVHFNR